MLHGIDATKLRENAQLKEKSFDRIVFNLPQSPPERALPQSSDLRHRPPRLQQLLANLAVAPATRGTGLGRALCEQCEEAARDWGLAAVMLQVEEANEPARGLYESVGYQLVHRNEAAGFEAFHVIACRAAVTANQRPSVPTNVADGRVLKGELFARAFGLRRRK